MSGQVHSKPTSRCRQIIHARDFDRPIQPHPPRRQCASCRGRLSLVPVVSMRKREARAGLLRRE
jgi:hypothetical protein